MTTVKNFFASRWGIVSAGVFVGVLAPLLQKWGNPANMGICVACMERDIAGALGLHRAALVQQKGWDVEVKKVEEDYGLLLRKE